MTRRPVTLERLSQTAGYFELIAPLGRSDTAPNGSAAPPSRGRNLLDEKSTETPKKSTARKRRPDYRRSLEAAVEYGDQIIKGLWEPRDARDIVGLYAALHTHVHGVQPLELREEFGAALSSAKKLIKDEFKGDLEAAQRYVAWAWSRARRVVRKNQQDNEEVFRLGWRLLFKSRKWLVDYKVSGR